MRRIRLGKTIESYKGLQVQSIPLFKSTKDSEPIRLVQMKYLSGFGVGNQKIR